MYLTIHDVIIDEMVVDMFSKGLIKFAVQHDYDERVVGELSLADLVSISTSLVRTVSSPNLHANYTFHKNYDSTIP